MFVDAQYLQPGDRLARPDGATATVLDVRLYHATQTTYDLTIGCLHTYYVEAGTTPVLVHNSDCGPVSKYEDITRPGARMKSVRTDVGPTEFAKNLEANGWTRVKGDRTSSIRRMGRGTS